MEPRAWTDERIDDLSRRVDAGFDHVDRDLRELRGEMSGLRAEMAERFDSLHITMIRIGGAMIVALLGIIAAVAFSGS